MKYPSIIVLLLIIVSSGCKKGDFTSEIMRNKVIYFEPESCCSNMSIKSGESIFSELAGYSSNLLEAVDFDPYLTVLDINPEDSLLINFYFTDNEFSCTGICNRLDGLRIEVIAAKKL